MSSTAVFKVSGTEKLPGVEVKVRVLLCGGEISVIEKVPA